MRLLAELSGHIHISTTQRYIDVKSDQLSQAAGVIIDTLKQALLNFMTKRLRTRYCDT